MTFSKVHPNFKINGIPISKDELSEVAYSFIKEGKPYQESIGNFLLDWISPTDHIFVKTSGSTGKPKTITLLKEHMRNSARATGEYFNLFSGNVCLLCLPCEYIAGKMMMVRALVLGLDIHITEPNSKPLQRVEKSKTFDFCAMVPLQVQASLEELERIDKLIVGGARLSNEIRNKLSQRRMKAYETYGMTETITHVAIREIVSKPEQQPFQALPNVHFSLDERGCLVIEAPKVSLEKIVTNDMVELLSNTEFIWLGRYDNAINSGGIKLFPEIVEGKLQSFLNRPFMIGAIEDKVLGQKLILVLETDNPDEIKIKDLNSVHSLEPYERPKNIVYLKEFIRTDTGKIQRDLTLKKALNN
ncbi:AMP-binding protein [Maribacter cobaltidurans]|uniref:O-succinylbenzoic acid--CoA ligase n=1 Tax=Maribacter cobaltidurans TaxID=1178778 RepID=A0A223V174_9FLAO|nr:AMP-binding protein [Maribacter cobaltidurans]ASV28808.1 O-succinylbenzoic acid--CoA ligase [Maribacter cobaltidurans]GGD74641.1 O-succinylbenzoic acid--CoA ligase [Maribacter cobaltidurans]